MNNLAPTIKTLIPDIQSAWFEYKNKRVKAFPQHALRASSIGHPCDRFHYHSIKDWNKKTLHGAVLQSIFDEGNTHETETIKTLVEIGFTVVEQQRAFNIETPLITGHIDGIIRWEGTDYPFDIKTMGEYDFRKINSAEDLLYSKKLHQRKYPGQLQIYLLQLGLEIGCFILKNKLTGEIKPIWMEIDYDYCEKLLKRAERVYEALSKQTPPERYPDFSICSKCDFRELCLPDLKTGDGVRVLDDMEMASLLERRDQLKEVAEEYSELDDQIKEHFKVFGTGENICGDYVVKVSEVNTTKKVPLTWNEVKSSYFKTQIVRVKK